MSQRTAAEIKTYSTQETMKILGVSRSTLYRALLDGRITGNRIGRGWRFTDEELQRILAPKRGQGDKPTKQVKTKPRLNWNNETEQDTSGNE